MKYNRKEIMKRAWELVRKTGMFLAKALKASWFLAKKEIELKNEYACENGVVKFTIWSGYGKVRAYYTRDFVSKFQNSKSDNFFTI